VPAPDQPHPEPAWPIDDPRIPGWVRRRGLGYRQPAAFAEALSDSEYALFASDGELIDLVERSDGG